MIQIITQLQCELREGVEEGKRKRGLRGEGEEYKLKKLRKSLGRYLGMSGRVTKW